MKIENHFCFFSQKQNIQTHKHTNTQTHKHTNTQTHKHGMTDEVFSAWLDTEHWENGYHPATWGSRTIIDKFPAVLGMDGVTVTDIVNMLERHQYINYQFFEEGFECPITYRSRVYWNGCLLIFSIHSIYVSNFLGDRTSTQIDTRGKDSDKVFREVISFIMLRQGEAIPKTRKMSNGFSPQPCAIEGQTR